jgi:hypothetical protein
MFKMRQPLFIEGRLHFQMSYFFEISKFISWLSYLAYILDFNLAIANSTLLKIFIRFGLFGVRG